MIAPYNVYKNAKRQQLMDLELQMQGQSELVQHEYEIDSDNQYM